MIKGTNQLVGRTGREWRHDRLGTCRSSLHGERSEWAIHCDVCQVHKQFLAAVLRRREVEPVRTRTSNDC